VRPRISAGLIGGRPIGDPEADWFAAEAEVVNGRPVQGSFVDERLREEVVREAAYFRWLNRGRPIGDPEADWFAAEGRAIPLFEQVLADSARVLGEDHPDTLTARSRLARAYEAAESGAVEEVAPPSFGVREGGGDGDEGGSGGSGGGSDGGDGGEQPEPAKLTRFLRAEFPARVRTGDRLTLIAIISEQGGGVGAWSRLRPVEVGSNVMLTCSATGFELRSEMQVTIAVPMSGDSDPAPFELVATDSGLQTITVRAFVGSTYLGALSIQVEVNSTGRTEQPTQHAAELSRREWEHGEVTLEIEYDVDKKLYTYRWRDGTFVPDVSFRNDEQLQRTPVEVVDGIVQELNTLARGTKGYSVESAQDWLKNQGIGLWQSFFPKRLQVQFRERWDKITRLSIIAKNDLIPWELLYVSDEEGELGYLAQHFPIARLPQGGVPPGLRLVSADFVRPPKGSPAAAAKEVAAVSDILISRGVEVHTATTDLDSLRGLLAAGQFSLLHFASHNSFSRTPPFNKITLGKAAFDPSFLNQYKPRAAFRASSPLIFINACGSDQRTPIYTHLGGWADAFLNAGAGAFIGSLWEVRDKSSLSFATELYTALTEGKTVGESIAAGRKKLRSEDPSDPTWLAYTLWGDPAAKVRFRGGA
jgi:CHAT domain/Protein of unknown function (DUF2934)